MSRLPNVDKLIDQITAKAAAVEMEKSASAQEGQSYTVPVAEGIYKLAQQLRSTNLNTVSYSDVREFAQRLMEHAND